MMGETIGTAVQFTIAERLILKHHGGDIGRMCRLSLEPLMDQGVLREVYLDGIEASQQLLPLRCRQYRQIRNSLCRISRHRLQHIFQIADHAFNGCGVEQVGGIFQITDQTRLGFGQR